MKLAELTRSLMPEVSRQAGNSPVPARPAHLGGAPALGGDPVPLGHLRGCQQVDQLAVHDAPFDD
jgi:hypothetical protein